MDWDSKTELVKLGNKNYTPEGKKEFQDYVLENVSKFDGQAWDMFSNLTEIIVEDMKKDIDYWKQIYQHLKEIDCNDEKFGFRSGMRIAMIQTVCEEKLKFE